MLFRRTIRCWANLACSNPARFISRRRVAVIRYAFALVVVALASGSVDASDLISGSYVSVWKALCPIAGYRHGFVDFSDLQPLLGATVEKPVQIDPWTSVLAYATDDSSRFTARLEVSRFDKGKTSGWIQQYPLDLRMEMRSELTVFTFAFKEHLTVAALTRSLSQLGFRELSNMHPGNRMGEKVFGKDQFLEEVRIRYIEAAENAPDVTGITVIGFRWKGEPTFPVVQGACP